MLISFTAQHILFLLTTVFLWLIAVVLIQRDERTKHLKSTRYMCMYLLISAIILLLAFLISGIL